MAVTTKEVASKDVSPNVSTIKATRKKRSGGGGPLSSFSVAGSFPINESERVVNDNCTRTKLFHIHIITIEMRHFS